MYLNSILKDRIHSQSKNYRLSKASSNFMLESEKNDDKNFTNLMSIINFSNSPMESASLRESKT